MKIFQKFHARLQAVVQKEQVELAKRRIVMHMTKIQKRKFEKRGATFAIRLQN